VRGRIRRALLKKLVRKLLKLSFEKSKIPSKLTSPDPSRPPSRGPGWCWVRFAHTPRRSPRRSPRRRSRARSTLRFPLARLKRARAFSPLARREHLLRDLSFAHDSPAPRARDEIGLRTTPSRRLSARHRRRSSAREATMRSRKTFSAPSHALTRANDARASSRAPRATPRARTTDDCGRRRTRASPVSVSSVIIRRHRHPVQNHTLRVKSPCIITHKTHARRHASPYNHHRERFARKGITTVRRARRYRARPRSTGRPFTKGWGADRSIDRSSDRSTPSASRGVRFRSASTGRTRRAVRPHSTTRTTGARTRTRTRRVR